MLSAAISEWPTVRFHHCIADPDRVNKIVKYRKYLILRDVYPVDDYGNLGEQEFGRKKGRYL
jgi:hypothetical protein